MKSAKDWCEEMFSRGNWVVADEVTIGSIQKEALELAAKIAYESEACCGEGERISNLILKFSDSLK